MRRRIYLVGAALTASSLIAAGALAPVATSKAPKPKVKRTVVTCHTSISVAVPAGSAQVMVPVTGTGNEYGSVRCGKLFGGGVYSDSFTIADSGDTVGTWIRYFDTGTLRGTFDLTPQEGTFGVGAGASYLGALVVKGGTGPYKGLKGDGTSVCNSPDGVHTTCTEKLKLKLPAGFVG